MAGVNWEKFKGSTEAKAMFRHCDSEKRLKANHTNAQIDKNRTHMNMAFGAFSDGYESVCKAYDDYIKYLDSLPNATNKRKDRVTLMGLEIPVPEGMDDKTARSWSSHVYNALREQYGDALLGMVVHFDEVHKYKDAETGEDRLSRVHIHAYVVPEVDGKLNGKRFSSRKNMVDLNNRVESLTVEHYPKYRFMTGKGKKSRKSVEQLKQESAYAEMLAEAQAEADRIIRDAQAHEKALRADISVLEARKDNLQAEVDRRLTEASKTVHAMKLQAGHEIRRKKASLEAWKNEKEAEFQKREAALDAQAEELSCLPPLKEEVAKMLSKSYYFDKVNGEVKRTPCLDFIKQIEENRVKKVNTIRKRASDIQIRYRDDDRDNSFSF